MQYLFALRVENKNLSYELYLRLKENESSFAELSHQYGRVPEKIEEVLFLTNH